MEWQPDWAFLRTLEERAATLRTPTDTLSALRACAPRIPFRCLSRPWPTLCVLTVANVYGRRVLRTKLARQLSHHYSATDVLQTVAWHLHRYQSSPARLAAVLTSPGSIESAFSARRNANAPAWLDQLTCGEDDERMLGMIAMILHPCAVTKRQRIA